jgi:hypothetical protein
MGSADPDWTVVEDLEIRPPSALVWPQELQHNAFFRRQGGASPGDDTIGDFASLKQMLTDVSALQDVLIRAYQYVIARYDVGGFRIDTLRYLKGDLPRLFGNAMREFALSVGKENFFTFGEVLDQNAELDIARFVGRNTQDPTFPQFVGVDAALDYPLFNTLKPVIKGFDPPSAVTRSDPAVREALWGGPGFDATNPFYMQLRRIAEVRASTAALRYGRFYMRPVSGDGRTFGNSPFAGGVLTFCRILADSEVTVVANTSTSQGVAVAVIVDDELSAPPKVGSLLYSNKSNPTAPGSVDAVEDAVVNESDGSSSNGALSAIRTQLQPLEVQIIQYA